MIGNSIFAMRQLAEIRHASLHETFSLSVGKSNSNISSKAIGLNFMLLLLLMEKYDEITDIPITLSVYGFFLISIL